MIIGLCGVANAGKSTVASILVKNHGFVEVALADPLKRICKEVFDFSDEQLWGPSSERNKPDERYPRQVPCHWSRAEGSEPFTCQYCGERTEDAVEMMERACPARALLTPRYALQQLGTEWGRECYPNVWVDYTLRVAKRLLEDSSVMYTQQEGIVERIEQTAMGEWHRDDEPPSGLPKGVVISDVRFVNEVEAIRAAGGHVWKIERPGAGLTGAEAQHASEQEQNSIDPRKFASVLNNANGPLEELEVLVDKELSALRFIYPNQE